jgi:hypothetical protein
MKKALLIYLNISLLLVPMLSYAQFSVGNLTNTGGGGEGLVPCGPGTSKQTCTLCDFFVMIARIIDFVWFKIIPALAALIIAVAGFMYIIAYVGPGGGPGMMGKAKDALKAVFFGLLIAYGSWLIIDLFLWAVGAKERFLSSWWNINCY